MERNINCYGCNKPGHFMKNCPEKFVSGERTLQFPVNFTADFPATHCPCGGGLCEIRASPKTGRLYYACPAKSENYCQYFKWCNELKQHEILHFRPHPYPICSCGAGVCRLETQKIGLNAGRKYFACRVKKGNGACNFRQWYDDYMKSATAANEIRMIYEALESGEIDLDSPIPSEEALVEMEINMHGNEMFVGGDDQSSSDPLPIMKTNANMEIFTITC